MIRWLALATMVWGAQASAQTSCRQALALGLDVSGSVDAQEYRLQLDGLAAALGDADVRAALLEQTEAPVRIAIYEWADPAQHRLVLDWTQVTDDAVLNDIQNRLRQTQRVPLGPSTGLGAALLVGFALLDDQSNCWTRTLDISGDGKGNTGQRPQDITDTPNGVTVNGLVIGVDDADSGAVRDLQVGELSAYYSTYVISGPGAFVETALGFSDYAAAMRRKLLRELTTLTVGQATPTSQ